MIDLSPKHLLSLISEGKPLADLVHTERQRSSPHATTTARAWHPRQQLYRPGLSIGSGFSTGSYACLVAKPGSDEIFALTNAHVVTHDEDVYSPGFVDWLAIGRRELIGQTAASRLAPGIDAALIGIRQAIRAPGEGQQRLSRRVRLSTEPYDVRIGDILHKFETRTTGDARGIVTDISDITVSYGGEAVTHTNVLRIEPLEEDIAPSGEPPELTLPRDSGCGWFRVDGRTAQFAGLHFAGESRGWISGDINEARAEKAFALPAARILDQFGVEVL